MGMECINLKGDAKQVVEAINSPMMVWNRFGQLVEDTRWILHSLTSWKCTFVNQKANDAAHTLAKVAITNVGDRIWRDSTPNCINDIVLMEQLALSLDCWWSTSSLFQSFISDNQFYFKKKKSTKISQTKNVSKRCEGRRKTGVTPRLYLMKGKSENLQFPLSTTISSSISSDIINLATE